MEERQRGRKEEENDGGAERERGDFLYWGDERKGRKMVLGRPTGNKKEKADREIRRRNIHVFIQQLFFFFESSVCAMYCPETMGEGNGRPCNCYVVK